MSDSYRCPICGKHYPSAFYFFQDIPVTPCRECIKRANSNNFPDDSFYERIIGYKKILDKISTAVEKGVNKESTVKKLLRSILKILFFFSGPSLYLYFRLFIYADFMERMYDKSFWLQVFIENGLVQYFSLKVTNVFNRFYSNRFYFFMESALQVLSKIEIPENASNFAVSRNLQVTKKVLKKLKFLLNKKYPGVASFKKNRLYIILSPEWKDYFYFHTPDKSDISFVSIDLTGNVQLHLTEKMRERFFAFNFHAGARENLHFIILNILYWIQKGEDRIISFMEPDELERWLLMVILPKEEIMPSHNITSEDIYENTYRCCDQG